MGVRAFHEKTIDIKSTRPENAGVFEELKGDDEEEEEVKVVGSPIIEDYEVIVSILKILPSTIETIKNF